MERGQVVIIAVVFAALALFGLKVWSDRANEDTLTSGGRVGDLARLGGRDGNTDDYDDSGTGGARAGRPGARVGERNPLRSDSGGGSSRGGTGTDRGGEPGRAGVVGGSAGHGSGGFARPGGPGGGMGVAGSSGGTISGGEGGGPLGQGEKARKDNLVDFLSSQPATKQQQVDEPKQEGDDGVTLKLEKTDDISKQGGLDKDVTDAQDGQGIEIGENGKIQFPNNVSPDAARFDLTVKPNWSGSDQTDNALIELRGEHDWSNRVELVKNGEFLRFIVTDNTGKENDISYRITDWQAGDSHDIQAQYGPCENSPANCTILTVDGRKVGEKQYDGTLQFPPNIPLIIGNDHNQSSYKGANATFPNGVTISTPKF